MAGTRSLADSAISGRISDTVTDHGFPGKLRGHQQNTTVVSLRTCVSFLPTRNASSQQRFQLLRKSVTTKSRLSARRPRPTCMTKHSTYPTHSGPLARTPLLPRILSLSYGEFAHWPRVASDYGVTPLLYANPRSTRGTTC